MASLITPRSLFFPRLATSTLAPSFCMLCYFFIFFFPLLSPPSFSFFGHKALTDSSKPAPRSTRHYGSSPHCKPPPPPPSSLCLSFYDTDFFFLFPCLSPSTNSSPRVPYRWCPPLLLKPRDPPLPAHRLFFSSQPTFIWSSISRNIPSLLPIVVFVMCVGSLFLSPPCSFDLLYAAFFFSFHPFDVLNTPQPKYYRSPPCPPLSPFSTFFFFTIPIAPLLSGASCLPPSVFV